MARPPKEGLDYFTVDCRFSDSVKLIQAEFGLIGIGCLIRLWQKIYGENGYYTKWDSDVALVFALECGAGAGVVNEVVSACIRRGIFNRDIYEKHGVLTSKGVQERYAEGTSRRESQKIIGEYLLIPLPSNWVIVDNNSVIVDNNSVNVCDNTQSKVKYSKEKYSKSITTTTAHAIENKTPPTLMEIYAYFRENHPEIAAVGEVDLFDAYNEKRGWDCLPNWKAAVDLWCARKKEREGEI